MCITLLLENVLANVGSDSTNSMVDSEGISRKKELG